MRSALPTHDAVAPCCLCGEDASAIARINRRIRYKCVPCGLEFELIGPKELGKALKLTPHETRGLIQGRQPWHHHGKPAVAMPATKPRPESRQPLASTERDELTSPDHAAQNLSPETAKSQGSNGSKLALGTDAARQRFSRNRHHER